MSTLPRCVRQAGSVGGDIGANYRGTRRYDSLTPVSRSAVGIPRVTLGSATQTLIRPRATSWQADAAPSEQMKNIPESGKARFLSGFFL